MDNFEWTSGYTQRFGLHYVNFTDPNRQRTPKESAAYYAKLVAYNGFEDPNGASAATASYLVVSVLLVLCFLQ